MSHLPAPPSAVGLVPLLPALADRQRLAALRATGLLEAEPDPRFDALTRVVRRLLGVPVALVSLVSDERQVFVSQQGLAEPWASRRGTALSHSFCQHVVASAAPLAVEDAPAHPLVCDNAAIVDLDVTAYLGVPVRAPGGEVLGSVCAIDAEPRAWTAADVDALRDVAGTVETEIRLRAELAERERSEAALAATAAELQSITDHSPDYIGRFGLDLRCRFVNRAASRFTGLEAAAFVGRRPTELGLDPALSGQHEAHLRAVVESGEPLEAEYVIHPDGRPVHLHTRIVPEYDAHGQFRTVLAVTRNLTAQREAEAAHQATRALADRLALVAAKTTNGVIVTDAEGRTEWVNDGFTRITGYTLDDMLGRKPGDVLQGPETDPRTVAYLSDRMAAREPFAAEILNYRKDGTPYWIQFEVAPLVEGDRLTGFMAIETDITERKGAEAALQESERRFRLLAETATDVILTVDARGRVRYANQACEATFGYRPHELVGEPISTLVPDRLRAPHEDGLARYLETGERRLDWSAVEVPARRKDGAEVPVSISFGEYARGRSRYFTAILRDVSAQKEAERALKASEEQYRSLVDGIFDIVFKTDAEGRWTFLNPAWERVTGIPVADVLGRPSVDHVHPEDRGRTVALFAPLFARETESSRHELRYLTADGGYRHAEIHARLLLGSAGEAVGMTGTLTDITDTVRFEAEREARERTEEMLRLKGAFLNNMSHELRTPLTGILGYAGILAEEVDDELKEFVDPILRGGERLMATLNSVLDLAQLESGELRVEPVPVDVRAEAADVLRVVRPIAEEKGLALRLEGAAPWALADCPALGRILVNLVGNAIKFTERGGVTVRLSEAGGRVRVAVADTGVGIDPAFLPRLFGEFTQASDGLNRTHEGNGLGLAITGRLVDLLGGRVSVESAPGEGSTFTVDLPAAAPPAVRPAPLAASVGVG